MQNNCKSKFYAFYIISILLYALAAVSFCFGGFVIKGTDAGNKPVSFTYSFRDGFKWLDSGYVFYIIIALVAIGLVLTVASLAIKGNRKKTFLFTVPRITQALTIALILIMWFNQFELRSNKDWLYRIGLIASDKINVQKFGPFAKGGVTLFTVWGVIFLVALILLFVVQHQVAKNYKRLELESE